MPPQVEPHFETGSGYESLVVTIGKFIENNWAATNPQLASPVPDFLYSDQATHNWPAQSGKFAIAFNEAGQEEVPENTNSTRDFAGLKDMIRIDIQAPIIQYGNIAVDKINNIILINRPNSVTRIKKSNGTDNSKIWCFGVAQIKWEKPPIIQGLNAKALYWRAYLPIMWLKAVV